MLRPYFVRLLRAVSEGSDRILHGPLPRRVRIPVDTPPPPGIITQILGPPQSGKTTLALREIADTHRAGGLCVFIDLGGALPNLTDSEHWRPVYRDVLYVPGHEDAIDTLKMVTALLRRPEIALIVLDATEHMAPVAPYKARKWVDKLVRQLRKRRDARLLVLTTIHRLTKQPSTHDAWARMFANGCGAFLLTNTALPAKFRKVT
jgi:hypothetical protein